MIMDSSRIDESSMSIEAVDEEEESISFFFGEEVLL